MCSLQGRCRRRRTSDKPAPVLHPQIWERPDGCAAPRRGRGHARPVPHSQIWGYPDWCTRRVGNAFMRSEPCPFAPEPGAFCRPVLPGRAWPVPYNGPAEPFWCGGYRQARTGGTHKCVPYTVPRTGRGVPGFANAARDGHGSSPTGRGGTILVRRYGQAGTGGMVGGAFGKKRTSIKISNRCDQMGVCAVFMDTGPLRKAEK